MKPRHSIPAYDEFSSSPKDNKTYDWVRRTKYVSPYKQSGKGKGMSPNAKCGKGIGGSPNRQVWKSVSPKR